MLVKLQCELLPAFFHLLQVFAFAESSYGFFWHKTGRATWISLRKTASGVQGHFSSSSGLLSIYFLVTLNKSCFTDYCCYCYYIFLQICATLCSFHIPILPMQKILFLGHPSAFDLVDGSNAIQSVVHLGATQRKWVAPPVWIPNLSCFNVLPSYLFFVASLPYSQPPSVPGVMYKMIAVLPHTSIMPNLRVITYPLFLLLLDPGPLSAW